MRKARYDDLIEKYENPIEHACDLQEGQIFICEGWQKPDGFCDSAWDSVSPFVMTLAHGGEHFYDGWMKNPKSAMISCKLLNKLAAFKSGKLSATALIVVTDLSILSLNSDNSFGLMPARYCALSIIICCS